MEQLTISELPSRCGDALLAPFENEAEMVAEVMRTLAHKPHADRFEIASIKKITCARLASQDEAASRRFEHGQNAAISMLAFMQIGYDDRILERAVVHGVASVGQYATGLVKAHSAGVYLSTAVDATLPSTSCNLTSRILVCKVHTGNEPLGVDLGYAGGPHAAHRAHSLRTRLMGPADPSQHDLYLDNLLFVYDFDDETKRPVAVLKNVIPYAVLDLRCTALTASRRFLPARGYFVGTGEATFLFDSNWHGGGAISLPDLAFFSVAGKALPPAELHSMELEFWLPVWEIRKALRSLLHSGVDFPLTRGFDVPVPKADIEGKASSHGNLYANYYTARARTTKKKDNRKDGKQNQNQKVNEHLRDVNFLMAGKRAGCICRPDAFSYILIIPDSIVASELGFRWSSSSSSSSSSSPPSLHIVTLHPAPIHGLATMQQEQEQPSHWWLRDLADCPAIRHDFHARGLEVSRIPQGYFYQLQGNRAASLASLQSAEDRLIAEEEPDADWEEFDDDDEEADNGEKEKAAFSPTTSPSRSRSPEASPSYTQHHQQFIDGEPEAEADVSNRVRCVAVQALDEVDGEDEYEINVLD